MMLMDKPFITKRPRRDFSVSVRVPHAAWDSFGQKCSMIGYSRSEVLNGWIEGFNAVPEGEIANAKKSLAFNIGIQTPDVKNIEVDANLIRMDKPENPNIAAANQLKHDNIKGEIERMAPKLVQFKNWIKDGKDFSPSYARDVCTKLKDLCIRCAAVEPGFSIPIVKQCDEILATMPGGS